MNLYELARPFLFSFPAEFTHNLSLKALSLLRHTKYKARPTTVMGIEFRNRVGLAAGMDKNADYLTGLAKLGFGFIEVGTVTRYPQEGNDKPRLFRLPKERSIVNSMGFNNKGIEYVARQLRMRSISTYAPKIGVNIGPNRGLSQFETISDLVFCYKQVLNDCDYVAVNISSPNTVGLRSLQTELFFVDRLAASLAEIRDRAPDSAKIVFKISPNLSEEQIDMLRRTISPYVNGIIASNTLPVNYPWNNDLRHGGLSGDTLIDHSRDTLRRINHPELPARIGIISSGGIMDANEAKTRISMGADLLQIYTGLVYHGPKLIGDIVRATN
jgi:dihydroorotate dehydrogenase